MICFEFPVSERTRSLLRLEYLYDRLFFFMGKDNPFEHNSALQTLFELLEIASRTDIKTDLIKELERQKQVLESWEDNPKINKTVLKSTLQQIEKASSELLAVTGKFGSHIRENEWLMAIRQRSNIPGGNCQFDLPSYFLWQQKSAELRREDLNKWVYPLLPTLLATKTILKLLRENSLNFDYVARKGSFQQMLKGQVIHLLRVKFDENLGVLPEFSANKHMLSIRFISTVNGETRARQLEQDIEFKLSTCKF